jgi:hypothetical protein
LGELVVSFWVGKERDEVLTRITYHAVLRSDCADDVFAIVFPLAPRIVVLFSNFRKLGVELRALFMICFHALATMLAECVLIERVHMYRCADLMYGSEICCFVSA